MKKGRINLNITNAEFQILWDEVTAGAGDLSVQQSLPHPTQRGRMGSQLGTNGGEAQKGCGSPNCIFSTGQNGSFSAPIQNSSVRYQNIPNPPNSPNVSIDASNVRYIGARSPSVDATGVYPETNYLIQTNNTQFSYPNNRSPTPLLPNPPRGSHVTSVTANQRTSETIPPPGQAPGTMTANQGTSRMVSSTPTSRPMDVSGSRGVDSSYMQTPSHLATRLDFTETSTGSSGSGNTCSSGSTEKEVRIVIRGKHETCLEKMQEILRGMGIVAGVENLDISMGPRTTPHSTDTSMDMQTNQSTNRRCSNPGPPPGPPYGGGGGGCSGTPGGCGNYLI